MQVRATRHGFYGATFHAPGDVFEVSEGLRGSWFVPVEGARVGEPEVGKPRRGRPSAGSHKLIESPESAPIAPDSPS